MGRGSLTGPTSGRSWTVSLAKDMCCDAVSAYSIRSSYIRELSQQRAPPRERIASGLWVTYSSQQVGSVCTSNSASVPDGSSFMHIVRRFTSLPSVSIRAVHNLCAAPWPSGSALEFQQRWPCQERNPVLRRRRCDSPPC